MSNDAYFKEELRRMLSLKASSEEVERLKEMEIAIKKPTKMTVLAAALYKKASVGELSAIKEIVSLLNGESNEAGGVILVDDIGKS